MVVSEPEQAGDPNPSIADQVTNLAGVIAVHARLRPAQLALVEPGRRAVTWGELEDQVAAAASGLVAAGLVAGQRIGVDGANSIPWVVGYLSALRAGLVVVPTDPQHSLRQRDSLLADCGARAVLSTREGNSPIPALPLTDDGLASLTAPDRVQVVSPPDAEALAVLALTLGTTSEPKIVMLSHRALLAHLRQVGAYGIVDSDTVVLGILPFFHAYGLNAVLGTCLAAGARLVIPDARGNDLLEVIEAERVDNLPISPGLLYRLAHDGAALGRLATVRTVVVGGAPVPWRLGLRFTEHTQIRVERAYGLTEASPGVTSTVGGEILGPLHVGRPLPGVEIRIGDGSDPSEPTEIWVRGANLFSGYWPAGDGAPDADGWFATGDIGYLVDGELFLVDRTRELVSVSGFTVYPSEVEQSIRQLSEVAAVAVVGRSATAGGGMVAFVAGPDVAEAAVIDHIQAQLPAFKRPSEVRVVDDLPRGVTGVVKRAELRRQLERQERG
ncbi:MAG: AMP-binding protein [Microlunatus sp.]|nr:AMP-binding protein [Microlunatus sp.]